MNKARIPKAGEKKGLILLVIVIGQEAHSAKGLQVFIIFMLSEVGGDGKVCRLRVEFMSDTSDPQRRTKAGFVFYSLTVGWDSLFPIVIGLQTCILQP